MRKQLKLAILESGRSQRDIAAETRIPEAKLSSIVHGWTAPNPIERQALQDCLGVGIEAFTSDTPGLETRSLRR